MICEILKNLELAEHEKVQFCARFFELGYAGLDFRESKAKEVRTKRFHLQTSALIQPRASPSKFVTMALHLTISDLDSFFTAQSLQRFSSACSTHLTRAVEGHQCQDLQEQRGSNSRSSLVSAGIFVLEVAAASWLLLLTR